MAFPFTLPTTSHLTFQTHFLCSTHPSLPSSATQTRSVLRSALKAHRRLSQSQQSDNLRVVNAALQGYLPYLLSIDAALSGKPVSGEDIDLALISELDVEWRPMLSASAVPGRDATRVKAKGLDYEIYSALSMLANLQSLLARESLQSLHASTLPTSDQRLASIQAATKALSTAYSIHAYLLQKIQFLIRWPPFLPYRRNRPATRHPRRTIILHPRLSNPPLRPKRRPLPDPPNPIPQQNRQRMDDQSP